MAVVMRLDSSTLTMVIISNDLFSWENGQHEELIVKGGTFV